MFFKCDAFKTSWVESDQGYQIEALIVKAANFTPCTLIVLRKEKKAFHDKCFEDLVAEFDKIKAKIGFENEVSTMMAQALTEKRVNVKNCPPSCTFQDVILESCNVVFSNNFTNISTFVFHGSALLLWLITYKIIALSFHSEKISGEVSRIMPGFCLPLLKDELFKNESILKSLTCVRRKLFHGQCARTHGSSIYWWKSDEIWKSDCESFSDLQKAVANSCAKALRLGKDFECDFQIFNNTAAQSTQSAQSSQTSQSTNASIASVESSGFVPSTQNSEGNLFPYLHDTNVLFQQFPTLEHHLSGCTSEVPNHPMCFFQAVKIAALGVYEQIHSKCLSKFLVEKFGKFYFNNNVEFSQGHIKSAKVRKQDAAPIAWNSRDDSDSEDDSTRETNTSSSEASSNGRHIVVKLQEFSKEDPFNKMLQHKSKQRDAFKLQRKQMHDQFSDLPNFFPQVPANFYATKFKQTKAKQWCGLLPGEPSSFHNHTLHSPAGIRFFRNLGLLDQLNGIPDIEEWIDAFFRSFDLSIVVFSNATFVMVNFIQDSEPKVAHTEISFDLLKLRGSGTSFQIASVSTHEKDFNVSDAPYYIKTEQECIIFLLTETQHSKSIDLSRILTRLEDCVCTLIFDDKINDKRAVGFMNTVKLIAVPKETCSSTSQTQNSSLHRAWLDNLNFEFVDGTENVLDTRTAFKAHVEDAVAAIGDAPATVDMSAVNVFFKFPSAAEECSATMKVQSLSVSEIVNVIEFAGGPSHTIHGDDLHTLRPGQWLNDRVINAYLTMLLEQIRGDRVHVMSSHFMQKLLNPKQEVTTEARGVLRMHCGIKSIFELKRIIIPYNINNVHWVAIAVNFHEKHVSLWDSTIGAHQNATKQLLLYLQQQATRDQVEFNEDDWTVEFHHETSIRQENSFDCGLFAIAFCVHLALGIDNHVILSVCTQRNISNLRTKIASELISGKMKL
jgi:sentrin-specific protease 1